MKLDDIDLYSVRKGMSLDVIHADNSHYIMKILERTSDNVLRVEWSVDKERINKKGIIKYKISEIEGFIKRGNWRHVVILTNNLFEEDLFTI